MITPSKFISFEQSIVGKLPYILERLNGYTTVSQLYEQTADTFSGVDEFMYAIDVLHVLGRVDVDLTSGIINHAG